MKDALILLAYRGLVIFGVCVAIASILTGDPVPIIMGVAAGVFVRLTQV